MLMHKGMREYLAGVVKGRTVLRADPESDISIETDENGQRNHHAAHSHGLSYYQRCYLQQRMSHLTSGSFPHSELYW